jgi:acyl carrier protein
MQTVYPRLVELLARFGVPETEITLDSTFEDLDLDSLTLVEFTLCAEQEFGVKIEDDTLNRQDTLKRAAEVIEIQGAAV